jgi:hypothetical protein
VPCDSSSSEERAIWKKNDGIAQSMTAAMSGALQSAGGPLLERLELNAPDFSDGASAQLALVMRTRLAHSLKELHIDNFEGSDEEGAEVIR